MTLSQHNPTGRFTGFGERYQRYRPSYPAAAIDLIMQCGQLGRDSLLVDVGCGTGISSRLFAERGVRVIGIEPNADMRHQAESGPHAGPPLPEYREGSGEATGLADGGADVVLAAQAFHWFQPDAALREFRRILKPDGWVALMWNERDESDRFTGAYGDLLRRLTDAAAVEVPRYRAGEALLTCSLFPGAARHVFASEQVMDEEGLLGRAFSASYVPQDGAAAEQVAVELRELFAQFQSDGQVKMHYETSVYLGQRPCG